MSVIKRIVCLANSRKRSGRCVAGKEQTADGIGPWVRPVSSRPSEEISERERYYQDGTDPKVLDLLDIPLKHHQPKSHQIENWLLDPRARWVRAGRATWKDLCLLEDRPTTLWLNNSSGKTGMNDRVSLSDSQKMTCSLYFLHLERLKLRVLIPGAAFYNSKRRLQACFRYNGINHALWVTDPQLEQKYLAGEKSEFEIGECFVTVSLGEPLEGYCYKLVATVITPERQ